MSKIQGIVKELLQLKRIKKLWPAQEKAIQRGLLETKDNFVIIAPTSAGKTLAAELAMFQALKQGKRVLYLLPMQALISEKVREFNYLSTNYKVSDGSKWDEANVVIATFESFYRAALLNPDVVRGFGFAVVDEFHVLYDKFRGFSLEKAITLLKLNGIRMICLSATFEDRREVAGWLNAKLVEIPEEMRAIKLEQTTWDLSKEANPMKKIYQEITAKNLKPCLIFCSKKDSARSRALELSRVLREGKSRNEVTRIFYEKLGRQQLTQLEQDLIECMAKRVAFHHSGLSSQLKALVEEKFRSSELDYLFATTSLAYGVNFPAKTVIICDLTFWDPETVRQTDVPVYLYIQMAGRAGRPQFGKEGYVIIVAKGRGDAERTKVYLEAKLEKAYSRIVHDDLFRKAILELVYSGRTKDDQILDFFKATFFNFQGTATKERLGKFDLQRNVKEHAQYLEDAGFLGYYGGAGFALKDLGKVTLEFLFQTFVQHELTPFQNLDKYLEETKEMKTGFDIIYKLTKDFVETNLSRTGRDKARDIDDFFEKKGIDKLSAPEYTAYAIYFGWMGNFREDVIETDFKVYASQIRDVANELFRLLEVYEALARKRNLTIPDKFEVLKDRLRHGVREDEVPFVKLRGIERDIVRGLYDFGRDTLAKPPFELKGTLLEKLIEHYKKSGERKTFTLLSGKIEHIGDVRARKIVDLIKSKASS